MLGKLLVAIPSVVVLRCQENEAELEMRGVRGMAQLGELGLCIGVRLNVGQPRDAWIENTTLLLSASDAVRDFCISCHGAAWMLWRWYASPSQRVSEEFVKESEEKVGEQLALAAYLTRRASSVRPAPRKSSLGARLA
ncbi:hypothetical protein [Paraburkholderia sediminicola]|uniref:hypothetical protein n=1 Tax=Paraburkholderia sediminicola TaxID=458836 RepID=UPI0038BA5830